MQLRSVNLCQNILILLFQLIGWQEVPRPNSRTEIVQAMRRIRVSIGRFIITQTEISNRQNKKTKLANESDYQHMHHILHLNIINV